MVTKAKQFQGGISQKLTVPPYLYLHIRNKGQFTELRRPDHPFKIMGVIKTSLKGKRYCLNQWRLPNALFLMQLLWGRAHKLTLIVFGKFDARPSRR